MKEGSEGDALPLSLSKKDASNNANNQTTSPPLVSSALAPAASPFLAASLSPAMLAVLNAEVNAAAAHAAGEVALADSNGGGRLSRGPREPGGGGPRDKVFVCSVCNRCFGYKHVLQNHERTHTGEKPFECKECHKRFTRDHHLKTHMRLHTGEKPYHCTHCERQFVQVANLRRHLRVHTGERPYGCTTCESRFSDSNQLKAHNLIHKGEKPFECKQCLGRFRRRHHLMHHKCPKDESNLGKPRRGRRPKIAENLEREPRELPTVVPEQRPKRERKSRETHRIIKAIATIPALPPCEANCYNMTSSYEHALPTIPPPVQTEPEDLSMHSSDNGDRLHRPQQQPPRPSSVPLTAGVHALKAARARTPPSRLLLQVNDDDGGGSESEAMVEEEEEDEDDEEDDAGSCVSPRQIRAQGRRGGEEADDVDADEMDDADDEDMMSEGVIEGDDEDSEDVEDEDCDERRIRNSEVENNGGGGGGGSVLPLRSKMRQQQIHHLHCHSHHHPHLHPLHHPHHPHHGGLVAHSMSMTRGAAVSATVTGRPPALALVQHAMPLNNNKGKDDENGDGRC